MNALVQIVNLFLGIDAGLRWVEGDDPLNTGVADSELRMRKLRIRQWAVTLCLALAPLAAFVAAELPAANGPWGPLYYTLILLPYTLLLMNAWLSLPMGRKHLFVSSLVLAIAYSYLQIPELPAWLDLPLAQRAELISFLIPLCLLAVFWMPNELPARLTGVFAAFAFFLPLFLVAAHVKYGRVFMPLVSPEIPGPIPRLPLPIISFVLAAGFTLRGLISRDRETHIFCAYSMLGLIPILCGLATASVGLIEPEALTLMVAASFVSAALLLCYAIAITHREQLYRDSVTGLPNRRALEESLVALPGKYAIARARIDFFPEFLKTYGPRETRDLLRFVAQHLANEFGDSVFRSGKNGFSVVITGKADFEIARRLRDLQSRLAERDFFIRAPEQIRRLTSARDRDPDRSIVDIERLPITICAGVAAKHKRGQGVGEVYRAADRALGWARRQGRSSVATQNLEPAARQA